MEIDKDKLMTLAEDPNNDIKAICAGLGISDPTLYQHMGRDPELKQIFKEARATAKTARQAGDGERKVSAKASRRKPTKRATKRVAPPAMVMPKAA